MNWVDFIVLIVVFFFAQEGLQRGLFVQFFDILGFAVALLASLNFYPLGAEILIKLFNLPKIAANPIGFLLVWLVAETIFFTALSPLFRKIVIPRLESRANKFLGFIPGVFNALLFTAFILLFIVSLPIRPDIKKDIYDSKVGSFLIESASIAEKPFTSIFGPIAKQSLTFLTITPEEKGTIDLEFTQAEYTIDLQSEQQMLAQVNEERAKTGAKALEFDGRLVEVARAHSRDMFERGYFSHFSPEGKDVGDRLENTSIYYTFAGENLALAPNVDRAHTGLMNSSGHRRNILDPAFSKVGIGVIDGGVYGKMFTQVFTN